METDRLRRGALHLLRQPSGVVRLASRLRHPAAQTHVPAQVDRACRASRRITTISPHGVQPRPCIDSASTPPLATFAVAPGRRARPTGFLQPSASLSARSSKFGIVQRCAPSLVAELLSTSCPKCARARANSQGTSLLSIANTRQSPSISIDSPPPARTSRHLRQIQRLLCDRPVPTLRAPCQVAGCDAGRVASEL